MAGLQQSAVSCFLDWNGVIVAGTDRGIAVSIDRGLEWRFANDGLPDNSGIDAIIARDDTLFICNSRNGIYSRSLTEILAHIFTVKVTRSSSCAGDPVNLTVIPFLPDLLRSDSVTWRDQVTGRTYIGQTITVYPDTTTIYSLSIRDVFGGVDTGLVRIEVAARANAGPDRAICEGFSTVIGSPAISSATYAWRPSIGLNDATSANPVASPDTTTDYIITVTDTASYGCVSHDTVRVMVFPHANAGPDRTICFGDAIQIGTSGDPGGTYMWQPMRDMSNSTVANPYVWPDTTTNYVLTGIGPAHCITQDTVTITVLGQPRSYVLRMNDTLMAMPRVNSLSYRWLKDGKEVPNGSSQKYVPKDTGWYSVKITNSTGRVLLSNPYFFGRPHGLAAPDIFFPTCVVGERKAYELFLSSADGDTLVIESARFEPYDSTSCRNDAGDFSISSDIEGLMVTRTIPGSVFLQIIPRTVGLKVARLVIYHSMVINGVRKNMAPLSITVMARSVPEGDHLTVNASLNNLDNTLPGVQTEVNFRIVSVQDPIRLLQKENRFRMTLTAPATLLQFDVIPDIGCFKDFITIRRYVPQGLSQLRIDAEGIYAINNSNCTLPVEFIFTAMLGSVASGKVRVQRFEWIGVHPDSTSIERMGDTLKFKLQGICGPDDSLRLVRPDGLAPKPPKLVIKPNPAGETVQIDYNMTAAGSATCVIHDVFGRTIRTVQVQDSKAGNNTLACDVADLPEGTYFITITAPGQGNTERLDIIR